MNLLGLKSMQLKKLKLIPMTRHFYKVKLDLV
jgi:hypothetical protein